MLSSCDVADEIQSRLEALGFEFPEEDGHAEVIDALRTVWLYRAKQPIVTAHVDVGYCAMLYVQLNGSTILNGYLDPRIVPTHWPGKGDRKKRKDRAVRLYWGPDFVSGDTNRTKSIHQVRAWMRRVGADDTDFIKAAQELGWEDELIFLEGEKREGS